MSPLAHFDVLVNKALELARTKLSDFRSYVRGFFENCHRWPVWVFHCCHCNQKWDFFSFVVDLLPGCFSYNSSGKQGLEGGGGGRETVYPSNFADIQFFLIKAT